MTDELIKEIDKRTVELIRVDNDWLKVINIREVVNGMASIRECFTEDELLTLISNSVFLYSKIQASK